MSPILALRHAADAALYSLRSGLKDFLSTVSAIHRRCIHLLDSSFTLLMDPSQPIGYVFETHEPRRHIDGPLAVDFLNATVISSTEIDLSWGNLTGNDQNYGLWYVRLNSGGDMYGFDSSTHFFALTGLAPDTTYIITLGVDTTGYYDFQQTNPVTATTLPDTPANLTATTDANSGVTLSFTPVSNAASYDIYRTPADGIHSDPAPTVFSISADTLSYTDDGNGNTLAQYNDSTGLDGVNYSYSIVAHTPDAQSSTASAPAAAPAYHTPTVLTDSNSQAINEPYSYNFTGGSVAGAITGTSSWSYTYQSTDTRAAIAAHLFVDTSYTGSGSFSSPIDPQNTINGNVNENGFNLCDLSFTLEATRPDANSVWTIQSGFGSGSDLSSDDLTCLGTSAPFVQSATDPSSGITTTTTTIFSQNSQYHFSSNTSYGITLDPANGNWSLTSGSTGASASMSDGLSASVTGTYTGVTSGGDQFGGLLSAGTDALSSVRATLTSRVSSGSWQTTGSATSAYSGNTSSNVTFAQIITAPGIHNCTLNGLLTAQDTTNGRFLYSVVCSLDTSGNWSTVAGSGTGSSTFSETGFDASNASGQFSYDPIVYANQVRSNAGLGPISGSGAISGNETQSGQGQWNNTFSTTSILSPADNTTWITTGSGSTHDWGFSDDLVQGNGAYTRTFDFMPALSAPGNISEYTHTHAPFDFSTQTVLHDDGTTTTTGSGTSSSPSETVFNAQANSPTDPGGGDNLTPIDTDPGSLFGSGNPKPAYYAENFAPQAEPTAAYDAISSVVPPAIAADPPPAGPDNTTDTPAGPGVTSNTETTWAMNPNTGQWYPAVVTETSQGSYSGRVAFAFDETLPHAPFDNSILYDRQIFQEGWSYSYKSRKVTTTDVDGNVTVSGNSETHQTASGFRFLGLLLGNINSPIAVTGTETFQSHDNEFVDFAPGGTNTSDINGEQDGTETTNNPPFSISYSVPNPTPHFHPDDWYDIPFQVRKNALPTYNSAAMSGLILPYNPGPITPHAVYTVHAGVGFDIGGGLGPFAWGLPGVLDGELQAFVNTDLQVGIYGNIGWGPALGGTASAGPILGISKQLGANPPWLSTSSGSGVNGAVGPVGLSLSSGNTTSTDWDVELGVGGKGTGLYAAIENNAQITLSTPSPW